MEVYIEYVILDNFIINSIIISLTNLTLRLNLNKTKIFIASIVGTIFAIFMPFIMLNNLLLFIVKLMVGFIIVMCFSKLIFTQILLSYLVFISYTFLMGGMCYFVLTMLNIPVTFSGVLIYSFDIPVSLLILLIYVYYLIISKLIKYRKNIVNLKFSVVLCKNQKELKLSGFLDTGNQIFDEDGKPIIVISLKSFLKCFPNISILKVATNMVNTCDIENSKYIVISTSNATTKMLTFKADKIKVLDANIVKEFNNITIGVSNSNFNQKFDCILHSEYV